MQEYTVIKKGSSIHQCIKIPSDFLDKDLEIKIRPLKEASKISQKLVSLFKEYQNIKPFEEIDNPKHWQRESRDEWK
jgi:hypothetical protein